MARPCATCAHPSRSQIEAEIIAGRSIRSIARAYGLDHTALHRHGRNHLPAALAAAAAAHLDALDAITTPPPPGFETGCTETAATENAVPAWAAPHVPRAMVLDETPPQPQTTPPASATPSPATSQPTLSPSAPSASPAGPVDLWQAVHDLRARGLAVLTRAETAGDDKLALGAMRELRGIVETLARLAPAHGGTGPALAYAQTSEWGHLRAIVLDALSEHPEARLAVATALTTSGALT